MAQQQPLPRAASIVGTWRVTLSDPGQPPAPALAMFTADGGYLQNATARTSTGLGVWRSNRDGSISLTFDLFRLAPPDAGNPPPDPAVRVTVQATIQLDRSGDRWSARFQARVTGPDGSVTPGTQGTATASRLQVEPLA
jgi:hypothetical protein